MTTATLRHDAPANAGNSPQRRQWLQGTAALGVAAAAGVALPLVSSLAPSERAKAMGAAVEVDTSALVPGVTKVVEWRGKPVWLLKRPPEQLADLEKINGLADPASVKSVQPEYARNTHRSIKPEVLGRWASALTWAAHPATWPKAATPPAQAQHNQTADKLEPASALFIESAQAQGQHRAADYQAIVCQIPQNVEYQVTVVGRC